MQPLRIPIVISVFQYLVLIVVHMFQAVHMKPDGPTEIPERTSKKASLGKNNGIEQLVDQGLGFHRPVNCDSRHSNGGLAQPCRKDKARAIAVHQERQTSDPIS